jgi:hypothetical protein
MNNEELVRKTDLALTGLSSKGLLTVEQQDAFFRKLIAQPTIVNLARTVFMKNPTMEINKVGFGTRILVPGPASHSAIASSLRVGPDLSQVVLTTVAARAVIWLPYDVLEDNIERDNFSDTVMDLAAERVALDTEEMVLLGDTSLNDSTVLDLLDGVLVQTSTNQVNAGGKALCKEVLRDAALALPDQYVRNRANYRFLVSHANEIMYRDSLADRQTAVGDNIIQGMGQVMGFGTPVIPVSLMPSTTALFCDPKNIIVGFHRNVLVETDKDIELQSHKIVISLRIAVGLEEEDSMVKIVNIGS